MNNIHVHAATFGIHVHCILGGKQSLLCTAITLRRAVSAIAGKVVFRKFSQPIRSNSTQRGKRILSLYPWWWASYYINSTHALPVFSFAWLSEQSLHVNAMAWVSVNFRKMHFLWNHQANLCQILWTAILGDHISRPFFRFFKVLDFHDLYSFSLT